jgi:hypothetical protein
MTMKRALLSVVTAGIVGLMAPGAASAQWVVGAQGGLASFKVGGDSPDKASYGSQVRGLASGILGYRIGDSFVLRIEPGFIQKGTGVAYDVEDVEEPVDSLSLNLNYISVPVVAQVFTRGGRGFATAGLDVGFLSSATLATESGSQEEDVKDLLESTDVSWLFGVGGVVVQRGFDLSLELRYSQSLRKVLQESAEGSAEALPDGFRSSGFQLVAGITWQLGGDR